MWHESDFDFFCLALSGCSIIMTPTGAEEYYTAYRSVPGAQVQNAVPYEAPVLIQTENLEEYRRRLLAKRYSEVGASNYNDGYSKRDVRGFTRQAEKVGAQIVVVEITPTGIQHYSSTDHYGESTISSEMRYDYRALYFIKDDRPYNLGVRFRGIDVSDRPRVGTNTGAFVATVFEGSPAFYANILEGDVVVEIDETKVLTPDDAAKKILDIYNQDSSVRRYTIKLLRAGVEKQVVIHR